MILYNYVFNTLPYHYPPINFDKGFGNIAAASSQYALFVRLAYSASLRFYGRLLLFPKKPIDFSGALC